jgi:hypothetical protein
VRVQVDRDLTTIDYFDQLLGLIKNLGRHTEYLLLCRQALPDRLQWGAHTKQARYLHTSIYKQTINKQYTKQQQKLKTRYLKDSTR